MPLNDTPQYNKQHAVPQNIMDVEFKLIGDLTMRQFFYVLIFFGIAYGVFNLGIPTVFKWPVIVVLVLLGLGFAFIPIEDRGLDEWVVNFFKAIYSYNQMIWHKEPTPPSAFLYGNIATIHRELITLTPTASRRKLEQYLQDQYSQEKDDPYDLLEESYIMKVKDAFASETASPKQVSTTVIEEEILQPITSEYGPQTPAIAVGTELPADIGASSQSPAPVPQKKIAETVPPKVQKRKVKVVPITPPETDNIFVKPLTPDRHAGRKFTSLLPNQGTIVLPIRGERVLRSVEEQKPDENTALKAKQLKELMEHIRGQEESAAKTEAVKVGDQANALMEKLQRENEELLKQIAALKQNQPGEQDEIAKLEEKSAETIQTIARLKEQVSSLREDEGNKLGTIPEHLKQMTPNTIAGVVRNFRGTNLANVLLVIKNARNEPVRAIKTNGVGEFSVTNPLMNGRYKLETDVNGTTSFRFDIIEFDARGEVIPAMEIVGK